MKDYAEEELGVTGGEWQLGDETDAHYDMNLGESGCRVNLFREPTYRGEPGISRQEMRNVMHLLAASKDLYNALSEIVNNAEVVGDWDYAKVPSEAYAHAWGLLHLLYESCLPQAQSGDKSK